MSKNEVKITFTVPTEYYTSAQAAAKKEGVTLTHIIRRAMRTEQFLKEEESAGKKVLIDDGKTVQRLIRM